MRLLLNGKLDFNQCSFDSRVVNHLARYVSLGRQVWSIHNQLINHTINLGSEYAMYYKYEYKEGRYETNN